MTNDKVECRLAAVLAADVVGYSRLIGEDETVDPATPNWHWALRAEALYDLGRYDAAVATYERMPNLPFWIHRTLAACHGQLGNIDKARSHWARLLEEIPDSKAVREFTDLYARDAAVHEHWFQGLQKAGLTD